MKEEEPLVSVIIPTFNSERFLKECLTSLRKQTHHRLEVIVVDDGLTDHTIEIAKKFRFKTIKNPRVGRAEAKNQGIRDSRGEYLFFADSDMELTLNVIMECIKIMESDPRIGGVVIPERSIGKSFWVRVRDFERTFYAGSPVESARFFRADLAKKAGGFEEGLTFFEESTLPYKIEESGYNVLARTNSVILHHEENFSLATWLKKKFYYGETMQAYRHKYTDHFGKQMSMTFRFGLFTRNWRRFWSRPMLAVGVIFLKSQEYFAAALGSIYSKLS